MWRLFRLGAAMMLAASGLVMTAGSSQATPIEVVDCDVPPVNNPGVTVPPTVPVVGGVKILGDEDPCAELVRTLVFVGVANITNGVNFAGTGTGSGAFGPGAPTPDTPPLGTPHPDTGGGYTYTGNCVMVNWETPADSSAPVDPLVTDCEFGTTNGEYHDPTQANPIINPIGAGLEGGGPGYQGLDWAPANQASCINSSGSGISAFTSTAPVGALGSTVETWTSTYGWNNSLNNLRGDISLPGGTVYAFDAKIQTQADPQAPGTDATAAGCIEKTVNALTSTPNTLSTGLNGVLVAGTATWRSTVPTTL